MRANKVIMASAMLTVMLSMPGCLEKPPALVFEKGIFPDLPMNLDGLNSSFDDYNCAPEAGYINSSHPIIFSTNRHSSGDEFNLAHGTIAYSFGQTTGIFMLDSDMGTNEFYSALTGRFNTTGNEFGPYRFFSNDNSYEYMIVASEQGGSGLDLVFSKYLPIYEVSNEIPDPVPATVFNSFSDDAYIAFNYNIDTAYLCSDRNGDFDIFMAVRPAGTTIDDWFASEPSALTAINSLNTEANEKCPSLTGRYMLFVSDMDGGYGGFDIYYTVFSDGEWSSPVNMGEKVNSQYNEYRPLLGINPFFTNQFIVFSSDRPGGKGRYDLYMAGVTLE